MRPNNATFHTIATMTYVVIDQWEVQHGYHYP